MRGLLGSNFNLLKEAEYPVFGLQVDGLSTYIQSVPSQPCKHAHNANCLTAFPFFCEEVFSVNASVKYKI